MSTQTASIKTGLYVSGLARVAKVLDTKVVSDNLRLTRVKLIWNPTYGHAQTILTDFCNMSDAQVGIIRTGALLSIEHEELVLNNWQNEDGSWSSYHSLKVWNLNIILNGKRQSQEEFEDSRPAAPVKRKPASVAVESDTEGTYDKIPF
jgi:hypothetical protein